jgi:DNA-directed RNA polymerase subunit RPC12/RpoP
MGIKCSLFGHAFGETNVEREREEQGSEVVSTIREIQTCTRCGERRVVSENKEVTTLETPDDVELDDQSEQQTTQPEQQGDRPGQQTDQSGAGPAIAEAEAQVGDDGSTTADEPADVEDTELTEDESAGVEESESVEEEPPVTDDAEILDEDDEDEPEREPGEWPQEAADEEASTGPSDEEFSQFEYDDEESSVDEDKTDAEFIDADDDADAASEPEGDSAPEPETNEWPSEEEIDAASEPESAGPGAVTVPEGSFVCEGCGFSTQVESSSLREGDFCPECHKETLVQVRE